MPPISNDWLIPLKPEFAKPYYRKLHQKVNDEYRSYLIFPPADDIFNAFAYTPLSDVKVVILGQDPYHGDGQAHGLCFSVKPDVEIPPSLVNIFKEINGFFQLIIEAGVALTQFKEVQVVLLDHVIAQNVGCCKHPAASA